MGLRSQMVRLGCGLALGGASFAACRGAGGGSPLAPASPSRGEARILEIDMPIRQGDSTNSAYGIWPFGVHGGGHAVDGHPGFDVEFRPGAPVLAAADGTVDNLITDPNFANRKSMMLRYAGGSRSDYFIAYTNLEAVPDTLRPGVTVTRGQVIGMPGVQPGGGSRPDFAMIHFGVYDGDNHEPALSNVGAVSPEVFMSPGARAQLAEIWRTAAYVNEWCEPFLANSRATQFPMSRTWTLQSGNAPAQIVVRSPTDSPTGFEYSVLAANGTPLENGKLRVGWDGRPNTTVDFVPDAGTIRLGLYDIVDGTLQLSLGDAGAARPLSFSGAATYTTK